MFRHLLLRLVPLLALLGLWCSQSQVRVLAAPTNDNFSNAYTISGISGSTTGSNVGATTESGEPGYVGGHSSGASVWYRWTAPVSGGATFTTAGSDFDNVLGVFTGSRVNALTEQMGGGGDGTGTSVVTFNAVAGVTYSIGVFGHYGNTGNFVLRWVPGPSNDNFSNAQLLQGLSVDVAGSNVGASTESGEPGYVGGHSSGASVWYRWTAPVSGGATFTTAGSDFDNVLGVFTGSRVYALTEQGGGGGDGSGTSTVTFNAVAGVTYNIAVDGHYGNMGNIALYGGQAPSNDNFANAQIIGGSQGIFRGINLPASSEPGEPLHAGLQGGSSVWFRWTAPASNDVIFNTDGSDFDTLLAAYVGPDVAHLTPIASNDNYPKGINGSSLITFHATAGETYFIAVDGYGGYTGHYVLNWAYLGGHTHVLWTRADGTAVIWNLGADGVAPIHPRYYGPFTDGPGRNWTAQAIADGPDGMTHVLWTRADGMATLWDIVADGVAPLYPKLYGPFTDGPGFNWNAKTISIAPNGTTHVLWTRVDGTAVIWNLGTNGVAPLHPRYYGPFTDGPGRNWAAQAIADGPDGMTHVLWTRADGMAALWDIVADGVAPLHPILYGPFTDGPGFNWTAKTISVAPSGTTHVLWTRADRTAVIWNLGADGVAPLHPRYYGSFSDGPGLNWTAPAISDGPDGMTHVLWTRADGMAALWNIVADGVAPLYPTLYGPFTDGPGFNWNATGLSVSP